MTWLGPGLRWSGGRSDAERQEPTGREMGGRSEGEAGPGLGAGVNCSGQGFFLKRSLPFSGRPQKGCVLELSLLWDPRGVCTLGRSRRGKRKAFCSRTKQLCKGLSRGRNPTSFWHILEWTIVEVATLEMDSLKTARPLKSLCGRWSHWRLRTQRTGLGPSGHTSSYPRGCKHFALLRSP